MKTNKIYVASSWRNKKHPVVVETLREIGYEVYDYRNPNQNGTGFHWSGIDPNWKDWTAQEFVHQLFSSNLCKKGFDSDFNAMKTSDACVLVLPSGRSAHLEAGWFCGAGKPVIALIEKQEPELMYRMMYNIVTTLSGLKECLFSAVMRSSTLKES